mmetsp:Transcript_47653/g.144104  ORF Transcript_47653/g.144104 Transcript_47653/m.144104 type:complete len:96 (+) Transcript_47653:323-610(+)
MESPGSKRIISADPGLMTPEQLLAAHKGGRRRTLEQLIAKHNQLNLSDGRETILSELRRKTKWFLDQARIKISVSCREPKKEEAELINLCHPLPI